MPGRAWLRWEGLHLANEGTVGSVCEPIEVCRAATVEVVVMRRALSRRNSCSSRCCHQLKIYALDGERGERGQLRILRSRKRRQRLGGTHCQRI